MPSLPLLLSALPIISTLIGGLVVYKWKKDLHPWLSLSGGILLGVAFLDLLPEAIEQAGISEMGSISTKWILGTALLAIVFFHILDKALSFHAHHHHPDERPDEHCDNEKHGHTKTYLRAGSMILHSMLDGVAIGAGFAADQQLGILVTLAVITHDFSDGMSTVTILKHGLGHIHRAILPLLILDALAPFAGAMVGGVLGLQTGIISLLLAVFSGFFIFLALSELLPQAHSGRMSKLSGVVLTILGIALVVFIQSVAKI